MSTKRKLIVGALALFAMTLCLAAGIRLGSRYDPADARATATAEPVVEPTAEPTEEPLLTIEDIEQKRDELTDLQWEEYAENVVGEEIAFGGKVIDVEKDGDVQISDGRKMMTVVVLKGLERDRAIQIEKDHLVQGTGHVQEVSLFLGLHIDIDVQVLEVQ